MSLDEADFWKAVGRLSVLQKRRGDFVDALRLWEKAASEGHIYAYVELAKYHEHRQRDVKTALQWTKSALKAVAGAEMPAYIRKHWQQELKHRLARLEAKSK